ncbi:flavin monoamine oxidase family protein [Zavarzinia aquatilis]|uniref:Amine oxidase domain-containing protein n=1 Tax=Zavarzinia aquatilis TaxID=2211142 RepID=A0A317EEP3_9PROT|nr:FAD-dependent oxidoreductase [Zavarzinia aquatilis]PWR24746.1 hypothetical protein DKG74_08085 [Zavarzinia aquatilis]
MSPDQTGAKAPLHGPELSTKPGDRVDVCVIGAGVSGLRAAQRLTERGLAVHVLEARDRVGGRTMGGLLCGEAVDLGGQWVGPGQTRVLALCDELGLDTYPQYAEGRRLMEIDGRVRGYTGTVPRMSLLGLADAGLAMRSLNRAARSIDPAAPWDAPDAAIWDRITMDQWMRRHLHTRGARSLMKIIARAIYTCEPHEISMLCVLGSIAGAGSIEIQAEVHGEGAQHSRIRGGAFQIAARLADRLAPGALTLNAPVHAVEQSETGVLVRHAGGALTADRLIVALPPALAAGIHFQPALPPARLQLQARMPMGSVIKALVAYERPFWRDRGWSGEAIGEQGPFGPVADATPPGSPHGFLVGFFVGEHGRAFAGLPETARRDAAVRSLCRYFGDEAAMPIGYVDKNWIADPWSQGGYAGFTAPGTLTACGRALRVPRGRIHWAGAETATRWIGYIDGAVAAGERAAEEVAELLPPVPRE